MQPPLFSVLIANYNNGKYIMNAIESVRRQTYTNWEIIIVDDCSTDDSAIIYKQLSHDSRIHIYYNDRNKGVGYTKHKAAELSNGEIIGVLDPDDTIEPQTLEWEVDIHLRHPNVSIVYSKVRYCDTDFNILYEGVLPIFKEGETYFHHRWHGAMNFASFKRSYYLLTEGIGDDLRAGDDQDLYFKMEEVGDFYCLDKFTYNYVVKGNGVSLASFSNYANQWYGDLKARYRACLRRGLNPDDYIPSDLQKILDNYAKCVLERKSEEVIDKIVTERIQTELYKKEKQIRSSAAFRLGTFLLQPVKQFKRLFQL